MTACNGHNTRPDLKAPEPADPYWVLLDELEKTFGTAEPVELINRLRLLRAAVPTPKREGETL